MESGSRGAGGGDARQGRERGGPIGTECRAYREKSGAQSPKAREKPEPTTTSASVPNWEKAKGGAESRLAGR